MSTESTSRSAAELAAQVSGRVIGDGQITVHEIASLETAGDGTIAYVEDPKQFAAAKTSRASCLIVPPGFESANRATIDADGNAHLAPVLIEVSRPKLAFALIAEVLKPARKREPTIHPTAVVATSADVALTAYVGPHVTIGENSRIGAGTRIEAGTVIGDEVVIGVDCVLHPSVTLYDRVTLGDRVILHASVCIGADGFGYVRDNDEKGRHRLVSATTSEF
jgi:UDP-3-O-[3-hydroxymyristoyl] glucosamine N-acyltransferase